MGEFRFRQFSLHDDKSAMKIGTDAVLLGAWADITEATHILDIGTGCGIIALMLAQRTAEKVKIDGIDFHSEEVEQAKENVKRSPWQNKVNIQQVAIQEFHRQDRFSHIVSNPPYYSSSLLPPDERRMKARHDTTLTHEELLRAVDRLLSDEGKFAIILPPNESSAFQTSAKQLGLHVSRLTRFFSREGKPLERTLLEFTHSPLTMASTDLILYAHEDQWSEGYTRLTSEFYLPR